MSTGLKRMALDIETNLAHSTIWICVTVDLDTREVVCHTEPSTLEPLVKEYDQIIMHNGIGFDAPVLRKLWSIGIPKSKAVDTLILSRLLNPQLEGGHSLKAWGQRLRNNKINFEAEDFNNGLTDEMREYCIQDTKLTCDLYTHLMAELNQWTNPTQSILLEHDIAVICRNQEANGFRLDVPEAMSLRAELADKMGVLEANVQSVFPPIVEERWSEKTGKRLKDKVTIFNLASRKQIADRLTGLGWKPQKHTEKGQPIVDESTLEGIDIPEAQMIAEYLMMQKRVGLIDSWLKFAKDDDRVHGAIITNGAVTGRMTHHSPNMGQIPSVSKPYGERCRQLWTVDTGNVLVGTDLAGIELRCLAHYMQDDDWTEELLNGDIHQKNADAAGITRPQAKTLIYATLYGAGPSKIGSIVGGGAKEGQEVLSRFYANTPALSRLMEKVKKVASKGYVPGLDGRRIIVRSEHAALNSLLQGCGAIIAKQWCIEAHKKFKQQRTPVLQVAFVHDEIQIETQEKYGEQVAQIMCDAASQAGITLGFRCPVDAESKIGKNWFDTH
jgi:DNA polymerase I-like protein with 3'-5' exonuclease and polymerase domains